MYIIAPKTMAGVLKGWDKMTTYPSTCNNLMSQNWAKCGEKMAKSQVEEQFHIKIIG